MVKQAITATILAITLATLSDGMTSAAAADLLIRHDTTTHTLSVFRQGDSKPILTQNARPDFRPYLHPIVAPDGNGVVTEFSPGHHPHQTGLYWGFTRVNGRDYFHHPESSHWRRVDAKILKGETESSSDSVRWQTVYDLLDANGQAVLTETQIWTMRAENGEYVLDLQWTGEGRVDVTIGKYDYGGLFLRVPWKPGIRGEVVNGARQRDQRAEGQRAPWVDVGIQLEGRDDLAHIAIFDHAKNPAFPQPWRVDNQLGVGPVRARLGDWKIAKGEKSLIRHEIRVYTGELDDVELTNQWGRYSGQGGTYALWGLAQREGREAEFLTPAAAVKEMTLQAGFRATAWASEPMMTQPMAFCWDDRGRMWVAENRDYETRGRGFSNSGDSRILILEDTDRDGVADSRKVFLEGIPFPSAIAVGFGGLWLGAPPNLLFIPDQDGDDLADMDATEVRLTGWGIRDRHETLNSMHWGPDGWLYGCQGFATPSQVGKPADRGRIYRAGEPFPRDFKFLGDPVDINGGVWRYHPTKDRFEVVAHGFSNPWGIDYDAKGQLFISACVIPHLWHVIPGGIYHRQGGQHFSPYVYSDIRTITDHRHRSAHGGARIYLSDAFPQQYRERIFMANIHEHAVLTDVLEPSGSGFIGRHGDDFLLANNAQWIGFSMEIGPEGDVYVLDWHDADICGKDVLNKDTGRIFRVSPVESRAVHWEGRYGDLTRLSDLALSDLQRSESAWHARRARVILQSRAAGGSIHADATERLHAILSNDGNSDHRLRALWALHVAQALDSTKLVELLGDSDEYVRAWSVQLLCEDESPAAAALAQFVTMARNDPSPVVRLYLAAAMQRVANSSAWLLAEALAGHSEDSLDHNIPKMIWFGLEPRVIKDPSRALDLANATSIPLLARHIARRLTDDNQLDAVILAAQVSDAPAALLLGMRDGLEGQFDVEAPAAWANAHRHFARGSQTVARLARELSQQFGDVAAVEEMASLLQDSEADAVDRRQALRGLAGRKHPKLRSYLVTLLDDPQLGRDAIRAIASFDDRRLGRELLNRYPQLSTEDKLEAIHCLATRPSYGRMLSEAIRSGDVPRRDVPAYVARLLRRVVGTGFVEVWGPIDELSSDKEAAFSKYAGLLSKEALSAADPTRGRLVFNRTCHQCHRLYDTGGRIGPDITGANRGNLEYLLGNILTPSAIIQDAYKMQLVLTDEGRVYSGILAGENERQIQLLVAGEEQPVVIAKASIESQEIAPVSMMPEGLLRNLKDEEVLDLIAYLQSSAQVPVAPE